MLSISHKLWIAVALPRERFSPTTLNCHSIQISEWQLTHGKRTVDSSELTGTSGYNRTVNLVLPLFRCISDLSQEYETESLHLSSMTRSQDEFKQLAGRLDDNEVRL
jgi:hypothetical protein